MLDPLGDAGADQAASGVNHKTAVRRRNHDDRATPSTSTVAVLFAPRTG